MVNPTAINGTSLPDVSKGTFLTTWTPNNFSLSQYGPRFNWSAHDQSLVLGSYFWGYLLTSLPGGYLAERFGGRQVVGITMILSLITTAAVPLAAEWGLSWVIVARILTGAAGGPVYPALHNLISRWAPPDEKGKFVAALMGGTFGTVITWPLVGVLIENVGWSYAFYVPALITLIMTGVWYALVYDTPQDHPRISAEERDYIDKQLSAVLSKEKVRSFSTAFLFQLPILNHSRLISENRTVLVYSHVYSVPCPTNSALRKSLGIVFPNHCCSKVLEHRSWIQSGSFRTLGCPALFGKNDLRVHFRIHRRLDSPQKYYFTDSNPETLHNPMQVNGEQSYVEGVVINHSLISFRSSRNSRTLSHRNVFR